MASFDLQVEDSSPLISYAPSGAWADTPSTDALVASYSGRSLHTTSAQGATATINFTGTGISIFGGRRSGYGAFTISVDGRTITTGNANSSQDVTKQLLGSASGLANGLHTAVLTNTGGGAIDIDWVNVQTQPSSSTSKTTSVNIDDSSTMIQYLPSASDWNVNQNQGFMNSTLHFTNAANASASISFVGEAVAVYGTMAPDHANYQITVDGRPTKLTGGSGGFVELLHPQVLLYYSNNLGPQRHVLTMTAIVEEGTGPFMDIDAIVTYSSDTPSGNNVSPNGVLPSSSGPNPTSGSEISPTGTASSSSASSKSQPLTSIIAGAVGGVLGLILIVLLVSLFLRRRNAKRTGLQKKSIYLPTEPKTPVLPMQQDSMMEAGFSRVTHQSFFPTPTYVSPMSPSSSKRETMGRHSIAPSYYSDPSSYASEVSSQRSSAALIPPMPTSPPSARLALPKHSSPRGLGPLTVVNGSPRRPVRRPPTLNLEQ